MRLPLLLLACTMPAALAAQDAAPARERPRISVTPATAPAPAPAEAAAQPAPPTCDDLRAAARREHEAREAARIAANDDGLRYAFFFECPAEVAAADAEEARWAAINADIAEVNAAADRPLPITTRRITSTTPGSDTERYAGLDRRSYGETTASTRPERPSYDGEMRSERQTTQRCTETMFERSCSTTTTFTTGNSEEGRNAAREALERSLEERLDRIDNAQ